ncbi:MAG: hypothetical protein H2045_02460 [Rhizobiales bacterium]|nr:hypothetical protein [Hyphomicrobiales bacterium]
MMKMIAILVAGLFLVGCDTTRPGNRAAGGALIGAGSGAAIGALAGGGRGAAIGALAGGAAGALIGAATTPGECRYRDRRGRVYVERCPRGYRR